jgi:hypothetical protein
MSDVTLESIPTFEEIVKLADEPAHGDHPGATSSLPQAEHATPSQFEEARPRTQAYVMLLGTGGLRESERRLSGMHLEASSSDV